MSGVDRSIPIATDYRSCSIIASNGPRDERAKPMVKFRLVLAWGLLIASLAGWAGSLAGWWFADEPIGVLSLSWFAITITAWDVISTTDVRHKQED